jgi:hypothetical protein
MISDDFEPLTPEELAVEGVTALPDKEVASILDLAADVDLAIYGAAPTDLAVALNANVVAPIDAAVSANILSDNATSQALADQGVILDQTIAADATATGTQGTTIDQSDTTTDGTGGMSSDGSGGDQAMMAVTADAGDAGDAVDGAAASGPLDGAVVADSAGNILGTLDEATGTVVDSDGDIVGTLNETTGLVDSAGNIIGIVTNLVDGAAVTNAAGDVVGVPRRGDRQRARRHRQRRRDAEPIDG